MGKRYGFVELGNHIAYGNQWGYETQYDSLREAINADEGTSDNSVKQNIKSMMFLLAALLKETHNGNERLTRQLNSMKKAILDAPHKAEIALEKEKQKTADKQRLANQALPTPVTVVQMPNAALEAIERRIRRKW